MGATTTSKKPPSGAAARLPFERLLAPIGRERFLSAHWTRQGVHLREQGRDFADIFSWDALSAVLSAPDITAPEIKMSRSESPVPHDRFTRDGAHGRVLDKPAFIELFKDGVSFGITAADSRWAPLGAVRDSLYDALLEEVHTNVYCSPPNTQGFQCHYDLHEVFVMQIEGQKHWRVFWPTTEAPVQGWRAEDAPEGAEPYIDVVLDKGDVLYVPRGHWHYAVAQDSISLHVTVGVTCRKGATFLDWLSNELHQQLEWRRNMPRLAAPASADRFEVPADFGAWVDDLKASLIGALSADDMPERFWKATFEGTHPVQAFDFPTMAGLDGVAMDTLVFDRPIGRRHAVTARDEERLTISAAGCELEFEAGDGALIERLFDAESFTFADASAWAPPGNGEEVAELLKELVRAGLLDVRRRDR
ncbi:MAG: cupin domain-containing protein [Vicinamibacterales bacterium]